MTSPQESEAEVKSPYELEATSLGNDLLPTPFGDQFPAVILPTV